MANNFMTEITPITQCAAHLLESVMRTYDELILTLAIDNQRLVRGTVKVSTQVRTSR